MNKVPVDRENSLIILGDGLNDYQDRLFRNLTEIDRAD